MRIIDAHHHFWDPTVNNHPWLCEEPMIPFRYGDYSAIRQPFLPEHYDEVSSDWQVVASVTMEGEWDPTDPLGEADWMQDLANRTGRPKAHVAQAWLDSEDLDNVLSHLKECCVVKSVRHKPRATQSPDGNPGGMLDPAFQTGFAKLAEYGLVFDLQTPWWHLCDAIRMSEHAPEVPIILNHTGLPSDRSLEGLAQWEKSMRAFAEIPNAYVKISGLGLAGRPWTLQDNEFIICKTIDLFGPERCMFASNFPVDGLCGTFNTIFSGFDAATNWLSSLEKDAVFFGTAANVYSIE